MDQLVRDAIARIGRISAWLSDEDRGLEPVREELTARRLLFQWHAPKNPHDSRDHGHPDHHLWHWTTQCGSEG